MSDVDGISIGGQVETRIETDNIGIVPSGNVPAEDPGNDTCREIEARSVLERYVRDGMKERDCSQDKGEVKKLNASVVE